MKPEIHLILFLILGLLFSSGPAEAAKKKLPVVPPRPVITTPDLEISQAVVERDGTLKIINTMTCDASPASVCQKKCGSTACEWSEPPCRDCLGTGSEVMREIFSGLSIAYRVTGPIDNPTLIQMLMANAIVLTPQSPYDYYNSSQEPGLAGQLQILCGSTSGLVGVLHDQDSRPTRAFVAICNTPQGVQARVLERVDDVTGNVPLFLKLTTEIEIPNP